MTILVRALASASAIALFAVSAQAQTIDFGGLAGPNGAAFTGPYVEDGYSIVSVSGDVFQGTVFGNPTPSLFLGPQFGSADGAIETSRATTFSLTSFDLSPNNGDVTYMVEGFLGAASVYSFSAAIPGVGGGGFSTLGGNAALVDRVRLTLFARGTSVNIDNIVLRGAIPEPATWALMIAGFGMAGWSVRSRNVRYAVA